MYKSLGWVLLGKQSSGRHSSSTEAASGIRLITSTESQAVGVGAASPPCAGALRFGVGEPCLDCRHLLPVSGTRALCTARPRLRDDSTLAVLPSPPGALSSALVLALVHRPSFGRAGVLQGVCAGWGGLPPVGPHCICSLGRSHGGFPWKSHGIQCEQNSTLWQGGTCCNIQQGCWGESRLVGEQ